MKTITIMLLVLLTFHSASAQSCFPEGIAFSTQSQINSFRTDYPGCTQVEGDLIISGYNINSLSGLSVITSIGGNLIIECNEELTNLTGLDNVVFIGSDLYVEGNFKLVSIAALNQATYIGGDITVENNLLLVNLLGLEGISYVNGNLWIDYNPALESIAGLQNVVSIGGDVRISANDMLTSMSGLAGLTSVSGKLVIGRIGHLGSLGNPALTSLADLSNLTSIGGNLDIVCNTSLNSLEGLDNIAAGSIYGLNIYGNSSLKTCEVESVCAYLANPGGIVNIADNAYGCNTPEEVKDACLMLSAENTKLIAACQIYPNPATGTITIETPVFPVNSELTILNAQGEDLIRKMINGPGVMIAIGDLPAGVYVARITNNKLVWITKFIRQ